MKSSLPEPSGGSVRRAPRRPRPVPVATAARAASRAAAFVAALALLPAAAPVDARESDLSEPVDVSADRSEFDERAGTQVLEGNVDIRQGTLRIRADRIEIRLEDGRLSAIDGAGSPIRFEQEDDAGEPMRGEARSIRYDAVAGNLVLEGGATLSRPKQRLASERITFDARTQRVTAEGGPGAAGGEPGRVTIRIEPPPRDAGPASGDGG